VLRLTAPNPGAMTGPGTNSYLVGDPGTGYIAIDPGPADAGHLDKLWRAAGGDIRLIVCTHSHPDHAPGARPLQAMCANQPPILGLPSADTARAHSAFVPDRALQNGELLTLAKMPGSPRFARDDEVQPFDDEVRHCDDQLVIANPSTGSGQAKVKQSMTPDCMDRHASLAMTKLSRPPAIPCKSCTPPATPPTTCVCCCWKTACCSAATTS
jgi:hypothetical protein